MNHIAVKVPRPQPFRQRTCFLGKHFPERIRRDANTVGRSVTVRVMHLAPVRIEHDAFMVGQIQLDARRIAAPAQRPAITDSSLRRRTAAWVGEDLGLARIRRQHHAGFVVDPGGDVLKKLVEKSYIQMPGFKQREVQVFGKAVGLKKALLEARAAFEQPGIARLRRFPERGQHPAERIVFFNHVRLQAKVGGKLEQFLFWNHRACQLLGIDKRQAVTNLSAANAGSNGVYPLVTDRAHCSMVLRSSGA